MTTGVVTEHSFSIYDLQMRSIGNSKGEDLFSVIRAMEPVVVDSNSEWKARSLAEAHRAFVLGRTIDNETPNLEGVYFNRKVEGGRPNVFTVGLERADWRSAIVIHRLDGHFKSIFRGALPSLSEVSIEEREMWNDPMSRALLRDGLADLLLTWPIKALRAKLRAAAPRCVGNYPLSCETASYAYALMLAETHHRDRTETQKFVNTDENLFGDTCVIQEALLFGAAVLSRDEHVRRMARCCGLRCVR